MSAVPPPSGGVVYACGACVSVLLWHLGVCPLLHSAVCLLWHLALCLLWHSATFCSGTRLGDLWDSSTGAGAGARLFGLWLGGFAA